MKLITDPKQAREFFGNDAKYVWKKAIALREWRMNPHKAYEGCYESPNKPQSLDYEGKIPIPQGSTLLTEFYRKVYKPWKETHQDEVEKEEASKKARDDEFIRMRNSIFSIANRHDLFVTWKGDDKDDCQPEEWRIFKKGKIVAVMKIV